MPGKIVSLSITHYYGDPDGSFTFQHDSGTISHKLDKEEIEKIWAVAHEAIERTKHQIADQIRQIETPALLGYDRTKTIEAGTSDESLVPKHDVDGNEIPF